MPRHLQLVKNQCVVCELGTDKCCKGCKSVFYCSEKHRQEHFPDHGEECLEIQAAKRTLREEEKAFTHDKGCPEYRDLDAILSSIEAGRAPGLQHKCFCSMSCSRYMMARFGLITAYHNVNTHRSIVNATNAAIATQFLGRCDPMSIRCITTNLMIRVGSKQNAYDFIKFWLINGDQYDCLAKKPEPFLNVRNSDAFEPCKGLLEGFEASIDPPISFLVPLALIKLKLLMDIKNLRNLQLLRSKLPFDIIHMTKKYFHSTDIMENRHDIGYIDTLSGYEKLAGQLEYDLEFLFETCGKAFGGEYIMWKSFFEKDPMKQARRYPKEVQTIYNYSCDAWVETKGGYEWILKKLANACRRKLAEDRRRKAAYQTAALTSATGSTQGHNVTYVPVGTVAEAGEKKTKKKKKKRGGRGKRKNRGRGQGQGQAGRGSGETTALTNIVEGRGTETDFPHSSAYHGSESLDSFTEEEEEYLSPVFAGNLSDDLDFDDSFDF
ncbi:hypothetical protein TWF281_010160 [Arthrobotrys megalospora]